MRMTSETQAERRYQALMRSIKEEFPGFRLRPKRDDPLQRIIHHLLVGLTLGRMRGYLTEYHTTLGRTVYVTDSWDRIPAVDRWATMRHERVHLLQFRRYTFLGMAVLYLLVPLPFGLSYFRMRLEREAYEETLRALYEARGERAVRDPGLRDHVMAQFTSASYGWMWPFPAAVARWYDRFVDELTGTHQE